MRLGHRRGVRPAALLSAPVMVAAVALVVGLGPSPTPAVAAVVQSTLVSERPAGLTPQVLDGSVDTVVQVGSRIMLGGTFTQAQDNAPGSPILKRQGLLAFDATTGVIDQGFDPALPVTAVTSVATDAGQTALWVSGQFSSAPVARLLKLSPTDGTLVAGFDAPVNLLVTDLVVRGQRLYVGGQFTSLSGVARGGLAAVDKDSGAISPDLDLPISGRNHGGAPGIIKFDVTPDGRSLVAVGNFTAVAGRPRAQMVMLDLPVTGAARVTPWATLRYGDVCNADFPSYLRNLDIAPDGTFVVVSTTGGAHPGTLCDSTSRWEIGSVNPDAEPSWVDSTGGDTTYGVAVTGAAVYVGGHFRWENNPAGADSPAPGAVAREALAALDPVNGLPLSWNPGRVRGVGAQAMYATDNGLWVGSDTELIGQPRERHARIAFFPLMGGEVPPDVRPATWPGNGFQLSDTALTSRPVSAAGAPAGPVTAVPQSPAVDWSTAGGPFLVTTATGSTLYYGMPDGGLYARSYDTGSGAVGPERAINPYDPAGRLLPFPVLPAARTSAVTGAFYDAPSHRLYYVLMGDPALHYRYFSPGSEVVGGEQMTAPSPGVDLRGATGLALVGSRVFFTGTDGTMRSVLFARAAIAGRAVVVGAPGSWPGRGLFAAPAPA